MQRLERPSFPSLHLHPPFLLPCPSSLFDKIPRLLLPQQPLLRCVLARNVPGTYLLWEGFWAPQCITDGKVVDDTEPPPPNPDRVGSSRQGTHLRWTSSSERGSGGRTPGDRSSEKIIISYQGMKSKVLVGDFSLRQLFLPSLLHPHPSLSLPLCPSHSCQSDTTPSPRSSHSKQYSIRIRIAPPLAARLTTSPKTDF